MSLKIEEIVSSSAALQASGINAPALSGAGRRSVLSRAVKLAFLPLALGLSVSVSSVALAANLHLKADLTGGGEVPPLEVPGTGHLDATLDTATDTLSWVVTYSGLSGPVTGAHFHGPVSYIGKTSEQNAPIQVGAPDPQVSPFKGSSKITAKQAKELRDGRWYFNIHTAKNPAGEIRGQVVRTK